MMKINFETRKSNIRLNTVNFEIDRDIFNKEFEMYNIKTIVNGQTRFIFRQQFIVNDKLREKLISEYSSRTIENGTRTHLTFERNNSMSIQELQDALNEFNKNRKDDIIFQIRPERIEDLKPYQQLNILLNMLPNYKNNSYDIASSGRIGNFYLLRKHLAATSKQVESYQFINYYFGNSDMPNGEVSSYLGWRQTAFYPVKDKDLLKNYETLYKFTNGKLELANVTDKNVLINSNPTEKGRQTKPDDMANVATLQNNLDTLNMYRAKLINQLNKKFAFCLKNKIIFTSPISFTHLQADDYAKELNKDKKNGNSLNALIKHDFHIQIVLSSIKHCLSLKQLSMLKNFVTSLLNNDLNLKEQKVNFEFVDNEKDIEFNVPALVFTPHRNYILNLQKYYRLKMSNPNLRVFDNYLDKINACVVQHIDLSDFFYIKGIKKKVGNKHCLKSEYGDLKDNKHTISKLTQELNTTIRELWFKENRRKGVSLSSFSNHEIGFIMMNRNFRTKKEILVSGKCDNDEWQEYNNVQLRQNAIFAQKELEIRSLYKNRKSINNEMIIFDFKNPQKFVFMSITPLRALPSHKATLFKQRLFDKDIEKKTVLSFFKAIDKSKDINLKLLPNVLEQIEMSSKTKYCLNDIYLMIRSKGSDPQIVFLNAKDKPNNYLPKGKSLKIFNKLCNKFLGQNLFISKSKDSDFNKDYTGFLDLNYALFPNGEHTKLLFSAGIIEKNVSQTFSKNPVIYQFEGSEEICEIIKNNMSELLSGFIRFHQTSVTFFPKKYLTQKIDEIIYSERQNKDQNLLKMHEMFRIEDLQNNSFKE